MKLDDVVGNGRTNRSEDVIAVKRAFPRLGRYVPTKEGPHGFIDRELDEAIHNYQQDRDLRIDGWMRPDGETAKAGEARSFAIRHDFTEPSSAVSELRPDGRFLLRSARWGEERQPRDRSLASPIRSILGR